MQSNPLNVELTDELMAVESKPSRFGLSILVTLISMLTVAITVSVMSYYAFNALYKNKLMDTWAVMYLNLEQQATRLGSSLDASLTQGFVLEGTDIGSAEQKNLNEQFESYQSSPLGSRYRHLFFERNGRFFIHSGNQFVAIDAGRVINLNSDDPMTRSYLATRDGKLLATSDASISGTNLRERTLVQEYLKSSIARGQFEFIDQDEPHFGFFYEVPGSNLILFSETKKEVALRSVRTIAVRFIGFALFIFIAALIFIQISIHSITAPLADLARVATEVSRGDFHARPRFKGFGEISTLITRITMMSQSLLRRDITIAKLLEEKVQAVKIEQDVLLAKRIQERFIIDDSMRDHPLLEIATLYLPATFVAGDWYGHYYSKEFEETVITVVDVSGHGVGSAMFTSIIASIFNEESLEAGKSPFNASRFVQRINRAIFVLGGASTSATLILLRIEHARKRVEVINCGHPQGFLKEKNARIQLIGKSSNILGIQEDAVLVPSFHDLESGSTILVYTDGLSEVRSADGRSMHRALIKREITKSLSPREVLENVETLWRSFVGNQEVMDDCCIIALKVK